MGQGHAGYHGHFQRHTVRGGNADIAGLRQHIIVHRVDDIYKNLPRTTWYCLEFDNDKSCARFCDNPRKRDVAVVPYIFVHEGDIHSCVDSQGENDKFLVGMEKREIEFKDWEAA